jgi:hypothetical protein
MNKFIFVLPMVVLAACQPPMTREQQLTIYRSRCLDYGFQMGTVEFAQCMQNQEAQLEALSMKQQKVEAIQQRNWLENEKLNQEQRKIVLKRKQRKGKN